MKKQKQPSIRRESYISLYHADHFSSAVNHAILQMKQMYASYIQVDQIGTSVKGVPLYAICVGKGPHHILVNGTHHAREAITTPLILDQIAYLIQWIKRNKKIGNESIRQLLKEVSFIFVPLVNPDGADLVLNGQNSLIGYPYKAFLDKNSFQSWKANLNGVDLNENYPTRYLSIYLTQQPGASGYPGNSFFSEPETVALKRLTEAHCMAGTISYHSSGREIYWYYNQKNEKRDLYIARKIAKQTRYKLIAKEVPCYGSGYKDWFIENYHQPALTIEVAPYIGPQKVPEDKYHQIWNENKDIPLLFAYLVEKIH